MISLSELSTIIPEMQVELLKNKVKLTGKADKVDAAMAPVESYFDGLRLLAEGSCSSSNQPKDVKGRFTGKSNHQTRYIDH